MAIFDDASKQAELLKREGNIYFSKKRFAAAIEAYTEAISLCPNVAIYWTNRALCHRKRDDWTKVEEDCRRAILIDGNSIKAHYMLGLALLQRKAYPEGVLELEKALDLGRGADSRGYMVEEIWQELAQAKYYVWETNSTQKAWDLQLLKQDCEEALAEKHLQNISSVKENAEVDEPVRDAENVCLEQQLSLLSEVFKKATELDMPAEVPEYLCCKITLELFRDPVITPSGITYERAALLNHLNMVGKFDPMTRKPLDQHQLVANLAMREAVIAYLSTHGWAYRDT